jgi:hypothetical protein
MTELAPEGCIICGKTKDTHPEIKLAYLAGVTPVGSMACIPKCVIKAINNFQKTGRTDGKVKVKK